MIEIRQSTDAEIADALAVHAKSFARHHATYHARSGDASKQATRLMEGVRVVAVNGNQIVGTVQYADHGSHIHLMGLAVRPDCQRQGLARLLVDWVATKSVTLGHDTLVTDTIEETGNVSVFEHLGFRAIERQPVLEFDSDVHEVLHGVKLERKLSNTAVHAIGAAAPQHDG